MTHAHPTNSSWSKTHYKMCRKLTNDGNGDKNREIDKVPDAGADAAALALSLGVHFNHGSFACLRLLCRHFWADLQSGPATG